MNPTTVPPADLVTGVVQHEYFRFHVRNEVESQVHTYLTARSKMVAGAATILLTLLGALGFQKYLSVTNVMEEVQGRFETINEQMRTVERLAAEARGAVSSSQALLDLTRAHAETSRALTDGASVAASQTGDLARAILQQVHTTQAGVEAQSKALAANLEQAAQTLGRLSGEQAKLQSIEAHIDEIRRASQTVSHLRDEVGRTAEQMTRTRDSLEMNLDFQRQLAIAKTFEIVLLRDGHATEITLPDFREAQSARRRQYKLRIEAVRIKSAVDFKIAVNGKEPAAAFDNFSQGKVAPITGTPFEVRVDSIYHAKLAYDFVLLRINPVDERRPADPVAVPASAARN
jgi:hypothetical protein